MRKDKKDILSLARKDNKLEQVHIYPPSSLSPDTINVECVGLGHQDEGDNSIGFNTAEQDTIRGSNIFTFAVEFSDWTSATIGDGGNIDVTGIERVIVTLFSGLMTERMGTMASTDSFDLGVRVNASGIILAEDKKTIDNGCDNTDDTYNGEISEDVDHKGGISLETFRDTGSVIDGCDEDHKSVSARAEGIIMAEDVQVGSHNSDILTITLES